jgi:aspartate aminotransferase
MKIKFAVKIKESATVGINSLAMERIKKGERVFKLNVGEPKIDLTASVRNAIISKIKKEGKVLYPPVAGFIELREEAVKWMNEEYGCDFKRQNCIVTNGGKLGIFLTLQSLLNKGDEVLLPCPFWVSYPDLVRLFGGRVKIIKTNEQNGWKINANDVLKFAGKKTKILISNSANNPTGAVYRRSELKEILSAAKKKNLIVISDEVYSGLVYNGRFSSAGEFKEFKENTIIIQSCSKNFAMTGLRVGFVFAPENVIKILTSLLSQSTSGADSLAQWAALAALEHRQEIIGNIKNEMDKRRKLFVNEFNKTFKVNLKFPESGIYSFIPIKHFGSSEKSSIKFCEQVFKKLGVAMVPGIAFGMEGYVRCSFGEEEEEIKKAIQKLAIL